MSDTTHFLISRELVIQNTPDDGSPWVLECPCGDRLTLAVLDRGTHGRARIVATHGEGEALREFRLGTDDDMLWLLGLDDPLGRWLQDVHEYEEDHASVVTRAETR